LTQAQKNDVLELLPKCATLDKADHALSRILPGKRNTAMRWGLFDGFEGWRPKCGEFFIDGAPDKNADTDYAEGYEIGRELSCEQRQLEATV
jgi:hypothetical protein